MICDWLLCDFLSKLIGFIATLVLMSIVIITSIGIVIWIFIKLVDGLD